MVEPPSRWLGGALLLVFLALVVIGLFFIAGAFLAHVGLPLLASVAPASLGWSIVRRQPYRAWRALLGAGLPLATVPTVVGLLGGADDPTDGWFLLFVGVVVVLLVGSALSIVALPSATDHRQNGCSV